MNCVNTLLTSVRMVVTSRWRTPMPSSSGLHGGLVVCAMYLQAGCVLVLLGHVRGESKKHDTNHHVPAGSDRTCSGREIATCLQADAPAVHVHRSRACQAVSPHCMMGPCLRSVAPCMLSLVTMMAMLSRSCGALVSCAARASEAHCRVQCNESGYIQRS